MQFPVASKAVALKISVLLDHDLLLLFDLRIPLTGGPEQTNHGYTFHSKCGISKNSEKFRGACSESLMETNATSDPVVLLFSGMVEPRQRFFFFRI